ncbi:hypothetical protein AQUSIP_02900 [Aquicella siphonis]|uniref:Uncharacterized protein n=1 Tax=Aquicella siphonis TaxID=254247 RepID=A0A5E4PFA3_9COXI|nr:hypothetical protein [Aquicella siphonis]VVC75016.1 hypothetical protein AQUSIP_02900 [Aquicella siphonis]
MDYLTEISIKATAVATIVIAWFSYVSNKLAKEIKRQDISHKNELSDLYQAIVIVIATIVGGQGSNTGAVNGCIQTFKQHHKGVTKIFKDDN